MSVVDLHPEELIDKLSAGELTEPERERLRAHVSECPTCRLEIAFRQDLDDAEPEALQERPPIAVTRGESTSMVVPRARRKGSLLLVAVAATLCCGAALAAAQAGWLALPWFAAQPTVQRQASRSAQPSVEQSQTTPVPQDTSVAETLMPASSVAPALATAAPDSRPAERSNVPAPLRPPPAASQSAHPNASPKPVEEPVKPLESPSAKLFQEAKQARRSGDFDRAVELYRKLQSEYASSPESSLSRVLLSNILLERGDAVGALAGFERYLADDGQVLGPEALVGRARALEMTGRSVDAVQAWKEILRRLPNSVHAELARARLSKLELH